MFNLIIIVYSFIYFVFNKKAFSIMRDIDKTARKNNKKGFTVYDYFKVGYLIGEKQ